MPKPVFTPTKVAKPAKVPAPLPAPVVVKETFLQSFNTRDISGYGVFVVRTREPDRAIEVLKNYTFTRKNRKTEELDSDFCVWDCYRGWIEYPKKILEGGAGKARVEEGDPLVKSNIRDVTEALAMIQGVGDGATPWKTGVYVFNYPHFVIKDNAEFIVLLKQYCHTLPTNRSRVVLIVPDGYAMPPELGDDLTILDFAVPEQEELTERFHNLMADLGKENPFNEEEVRTLTAAGLGMTGLDFDQSLSLAIVTNAENGDLEKPITAPMHDFLSVIYRSKTEAVKRTEILELVEAIPMDQIGGMENVKAWATARKNWLTPAAVDFGLRAPRGVLVAGIPGTGKSLIPRGIAHLFGVACVMLDISKVFGKYVGESEARMDMALNFIKSIRPLVVWVDEVDKSGLNGGSENESSQRVLGKLLNFMQEAPDGIFWVYTANDTSKIPAELLRPGRLNVMFGVGYPNTEERESIFKIHLKKRRQPPIKDISHAVEISERYSGAEIEEVVNNAVGEAFSTGKPVTAEMLARHVKFVKPQSHSHAEKMGAIEAWCKSNAIPASLSDAEKEDRQVDAKTSGVVKGPRRLG